MTDRAAERDLQVSRRLPAWRSNARLLIAILCAAGLVAIAPFILDTYTVNILTRSFLYAMLAITVDLLWGYTGILTFGQAAFFGLGAYAAALVLTHLGFDPWTLALAVALAIGVPSLVGLLVGWLSFYSGSTALYASVVSLVLPIMVTQILFSGGTLTGSSSGLVGYQTLDFSLEGWFWITGGGLILAASLAWIFVSSDAGRLLIAIRDNEARCSYLGVDTPRLKILLLAALAGAAGLVGFAYANVAAVVAPEIAGFVFGTELVIWVALGGRGTLIGPILGTIAIDLFSAQLSGDLPYLWKLILGVLFVAVIIVLPGGLASLIERLSQALLPRLLRRQIAPHLTPARRPTRPVAEPSSAKALEVAGLGKSYGSLTVLEGVDLTVRRGELVSLVGPNGAGKTTLMRCLGDGTEAGAGDIRVNGHDIRGLPPNRVVGRGLGRKFQTASVFESLTIAECLRIARYRHEAPSPSARADDLSLPAAALAVLKTTGLDAMLQVRAGLLSHGQKQALELAMVIALEPTLILLDEPTAGLTKAERGTIGAVLRDLTATGDIAVVLVEHDLDFVRDISSRIVVLHQGRVVLDGGVKEVVASDLVKAIYAGSGPHG